MPIHLDQSTCQISGQTEGAQSVSNCLLRITGNGLGTARRGNSSRLLLKYYKNVSIF